MTTGFFTIYIGNNIYINWGFGLFLIGYLISVMELGQFEKNDITLLKQIKIETGKNTKEIHEIKVELQNLTPLLQTMLELIKEQNING